MIDLANKIKVDICWEIFLLRKERHVKRKPFISYLPLFGSGHQSVECDAWCYSSHLVTMRKDNTKSIGERSRNTEGTWIISSGFSYCLGIFKNSENLSYELNQHCWSNKVPCTCLERVLVYLPNPQEKKVWTNKAQILLQE